MIWGSGQTLLRICFNVSRLSSIKTQSHTLIYSGIMEINKGMRRQKVLSLTWDQVKKDGFIFLSKTKADKQRQISINNDLLGLFKGIRKKNHLSSKHVKGNLFMI